MRSGASAAARLPFGGSASGERIALGSRVALLLAALCGGTLALAAAPGAPWQLGWLAPMPLLLAVRHARGPVRAAVLSALTAAVFWPLHVRWLLPVGGVNPANFVAGMTVLALLFAPFGLLAFWGRRAPFWLVASSAWVGCDYLRAHLGFASIPWGQLAVTQLELVPLVQVASFAGAYGASFVVVAASAAGALAIDRLLLRAPPRSLLLEIVAPFVLVALAFAWGVARTPPADTGSAVRVALVQAGVYQRHVSSGPSRREVLERYTELTRQAASEGAELVVWPASSVPGRLPFDSGLVRWLEDRSRELGVPLLVGASGEEKSTPARPGARRATPNSAFLFSPDGGIVDVYDKIRLLPFNEYLPWRGRVPWPAWVAAGDADTRAGTRRTVFEAAGVRFGVLICWESLFPDGFRRQVGEGLDFVVSMTNEAFTDHPAAHHQMLSLNRMRAVEAGVPVVRTATTGVSAVIDRHGRLAEVVANARGDPLGAVGYRVARIPTEAAPSFYARHGDWFVGFSLAGAVVAGAGTRRNRSGATPES